MKKILFVGSGVFQLDGILRAKEMGFYTIAMDGNPNAFGKNYVDEFYHIDICDKEVVLQKAKEVGIDAVVAIASEVSLESTAYVADQLNLRGYKTKHIEISHNKDKYYSLFAANSINVPQTFVYEGEETIKQLDINKYIIKPSQGSGSRGVKIVEDEKAFDMTNYLNNYLKRGEKALIQEFVCGKELTIDGFVINHTFHLLSISQESNDESKGHTFSSELVFPPVWMNDKIKKELWQICSNIVKALDLKENGPMHLEILNTDDNKFYVIDFSLRGGGFDLFTKIDKIVTGFDPLELYLKSAVGEEIFDIPTIPKDQNIATLIFFYPENAGTVKSIEGLELEGMHNDYYFKTTYHIGEHVAKPESGNQRLAYLICWNKDRDALKERQEEIKSQIKFVIE